MNARDLSGVKGFVAPGFERVAETLPSDRPLVIFHSWMAAYLTEQRQIELVQAVQHLGRRRPADIAKTD